MSACCGPERASGISVAAEPADPWLLEDLAAAAPDQLQLIGLTGAAF